jgi:hypothetical protein
MLKALGPLLQCLSIEYDPCKPASRYRTQYDYLLVPVIVKQCPLLANLSLQDFRPCSAADSAASEVLLRRQVLYRMPNYDAAMAPWLHALERSVSIGTAMVDTASGKSP